MKPSNRLKAHIATLVWACFILILTSIPHMRAPVTGLFHQDLLAHAFIYSILGWLTCRSLHREGIHGAAAFLGAVFICLLYGGADEWHQMLIPGREASWLDWGADCLGGAAGALIYHLSVRKRRNPQK